MGDKLLVIGCHGRGGVAQAALISVSHEILRQPPCPGLVVPARTAQ